MMGPMDVPARRDAEPPVVVTPATAADVDALAALLRVALADKYRAAFGRHAHAAIAALARAELAAGVRGYVVARRGDDVVGAAHVSVSDDSGTVDWSGTLRRAIGWPGSVRADVVLSVLAHGPLSADEAYIGEVAVRADARRAGVASALLHAVEREAAARGRTLLSLWVTVENDGAIALYRHAGFRPVTTRRWPLGRRLFRAWGATLMHKRIAAAHSRAAGEDSPP